MNLRKNLRDYRYGSAVRYMHIIFGLPSMASAGVRTTRSRRSPRLRLTL